MRADIVDRIHHVETLLGDAKFALAMIVVGGISGPQDVADLERLSRSLRIHLQDAAVADLGLTRRRYTVLVNGIKFGIPEMH